jgi:hypothetical protein
LAIVFPIEFPFIRAVSDPRPVIETAHYIVGAMMTPSHVRFGERLAASCRAHSLPLGLFEVPFVHRSISRAGSDDMRFTKANFVHFLLERYRRPVLYVDVDCVVAQRPTRIDEYLAARVDFAIFNWLAEERTEAYIPAEIAVHDGSATRTTRDRFFRFSHSIDAMSGTQLLCSGAVQWYNNTGAARRLLASWQGVIERSPGSADDKCLDFAFNNFSVHGTPLKPAWLAKSYARYAWWIYESPVINHPELPDTGQGFTPLDELDGRRRIYADELQQRKVDYIFPKDCLIDTQTRTLFRLHDGAWRAAGTFSAPLWL